MEFAEYDIKLAASFVSDGIRDVDAEMFRIKAAQELILALVGLNPEKHYHRPAIVGAVRKALEAQGERSAAA